VVCTAPKYWDKRQCFELDEELMSGKWGIHNPYGSGSSQDTATNQINDLEQVTRPALFRLCQIRAHNFPRVAQA